ncbi:alpha/beta fold hydrolase [Bosea sp. PAMC 26642]|uniref:alpha/beta hydrolase n=1 Tax=Bosea sp. (strain PAMC 26642) TaxID=1792307 RepID=UPI0009E9DFA2
MPMSAISRRTFALGLATTASAMFDGASAQNGRTGVVLLHGKKDNSSGSLAAVASALSSHGMLTSAPDLPWSGSRYLSGTWSDAMGEISQAISQLKGRGAVKVALVGHSMGCPAAMSFVASQRGVAAVVLTAPGHSPRLYFNQPPMRESILRARSMVKAGNGRERSEFLDNNQGNMFGVQATAAQYLSYFDPSGPCEMSNTAGRINCPTLWIVGSEDGAADWGAPIGRRLTRRPNSRYIEVPGARHRNTPSIMAGEIAAWLATV